MSDHSRLNPATSRCRALEEGDGKRQLENYRSYVKLLARVQIGCRLGGKFDTSDIVQEVFLRASRTLSQFRGNTEAEFLAWLRQVLASCLANQIRRYQGTKQRDPRLERRLQLELVDVSSSIQVALADKSPSPSEVVAQRERAVMLADALDQLSDDYREVVVLRYIEQLSFPELSKRMGRSVPSVKSMLPRALARLRRLLENTV